MEYDLELISGFVDETRDVIEEAEPTLIELSHGSGNDANVDSETINSVFRLFHSLKSSAAFLGFNNIAKLTHEAESLIQGVREGVITLTGELASLLCTSTDLITAMVNAIEEKHSDDGFEEAIKENLYALKEFPGNVSTPATPQMSSQPSVQPTVAKPIQEPVAKPIAQKRPEEDLEEKMASELFSPEMYQNFVAEGIEQLDTVEEKFLLLEKNGFDTDEMNSAYRAIHSFKGNCSFMQLEDLLNLSHLVETVMGSMREKKTDVSPDNIAFLLEAIDLLRGTVQAMNEDAANSNVDNLDAYTDLIFDLFEECFAGTEPDLVMQQITPQAEEAQPQMMMSEEFQEQTVLSQEPSITQVQQNMQPLSAEAQAQTNDGGKRKEIIRKDIRVNLDKLDHIINLAGELVIAESMVTRNPSVGEIEDENYSRAVHQLRRICNELQDASMSLRMVPLTSTFKKMVRVVHDLSRKMDKKIKLDIIGGDTEVDKTVIENIGDPLVHIIRNSCDHGIESSDDRLAAGKNSIGNVRIEGRHEGGEVWIIITDDGRGLNKEKIINTAIKRGVITTAEGMAEQDIWRLIFEPGFSTAEQISDISGRGVGMDVVKKNIEKMNGQIDIKTIEGKGTTFIIRIPLTLAIIDGMLVKSGNSLYTIPTLSIKKSITCTEEMLTRSPEGREILIQGDSFLPIIKIGEIFKHESAITDVTEGILILSEHEGKMIAILADKIIGQQQTVIKGLSNYLNHARGTSGCTILGDGSVSLILDIRTLMDMAEEQSQLVEATV